MKIFSSASSANFFAHFGTQLQKQSSFQVQSTKQGRMNPPWLKTFETLVSIQNTDDENVKSMRMGPVGSGMRSTQPPAGSDTAPSPGFHKSTTVKRASSARRKAAATTEDSEAFKLWKQEKDKISKERRKLETAAALSSSTAAAEEINAKKLKDQEHKRWIKEKLKSQKAIAREVKKAEAEYWANASKERDEMIRRKHEKLKPHIERRNLLFKMEREKYRAVTSGKGLPPNLARSLETLKRNPLNLQTIMVKLVDVNAKRNKKGKGKAQTRGARRKRVGKKEQKEAPPPPSDAAEEREKMLEEILRNAAEGKKEGTLKEILRKAAEENDGVLEKILVGATEEELERARARVEKEGLQVDIAEEKEDPEGKDDNDGGYGDDFEENEDGSDDDEDDSGYGDDFDDSIEAPPPSRSKEAAARSPTSKSEPATSPTYRFRSRTFALGPDAPQPPKKKSEKQKRQEEKEKLARTTRKLSISALKDKVSHEKSLLKLSAGQQYRHRRMIERALSNFSTVKSFRDTVHRDDLKEAARKQALYEKWVKDNPPKSGVKNRPPWENNFTNPESSNLNARDTTAAVQAAREATFRGKHGPGYGVDLHSVPEGLGGGTLVDGYVLDGVERALDAITQPDLLEIGSFFSPPVSVKAVIGAICTLLGIEPNWEVAYKGLLRNSYYFLTMLRFFDKDNVDIETALVLEQYMNSILLDDDKVEASSKVRRKERARYIAFLSRKRQLLRLPLLSFAFFA